MSDDKKTKRGKVEPLEYIYMPGTGTGTHTLRDKTQVAPGGKVTTTENLADAFPDRFCLTSEWSEPGSDATPGLGDEVTDHKTFEDVATEGLRIFRKGSKYYVFDEGVLSKPMNDDALPTLDSVVEYINGLAS